MSNDQDRDPGLVADIGSASPKLEILGSPEQRAAFFEAMAAAAEDFEPVVNDTEGQMGHRKFSYATLDRLVKCTRPALVKNKIGVLQLMTGPNQDGTHRLTTIVAARGAELHLHIDYTRANELKQWGMQSTYLRRYAYRSIFQLDGSDDADTTDINPRDPDRSRAPTPPKQQPKPAQKPKETEHPTQPRSEPPPAPAPERKVVNDNPCSRETSAAIAAHLRALSIRGIEATNMCKDVTKKLPDQLNEDEGQLMLAHVQKLAAAEGVVVQ